MIKQKDTNKTKNDFSDDDEILKIVEEFIEKNNLDNNK